MKSNGILPERKTGIRSEPKLATRAHRLDSTPPGEPLPCFPTVGNWRCKGSIPEEVFTTAPSPWVLSTR